MTPTFRPAPIPSNIPNALYEQARQCLRNADYYQAILFFQQCLQAHPGHVDALIGLGLTRQKMSQLRPALTAYRQALKLSPNDPEILLGIGNCYGGEGNIDKATANYERALKADTNNIKAMYNLIALRTYALNASIVENLRRLYDSQGCTGESRALVCFALAKVYEGHGDVQQAFRYYAEANTVQFPLTGYNEEGHATIFREIQAAFPSQLFTNLENMGRKDVAPIFVLGMPRSGTSLVEQILASHSRVHGAGEALIMTWIAETLIPQISGIPFPYGMASSLNASVINDLAGVYLKKLSEYCSDETVRVVDKLPNNFLVVGLIRVLFPRASIIHCVRDPMDTCWSLFRQYFGSAHGYCYDQRALGRYYLNYQTLMKHWHRVLPGVIHDVAYEELVDQPEKTVRKLLAYCELPWEDRCLAFYRTKRAVTTASAMQVRRPLYKTSLRSWSPVAQELVPLQEALKGS